MLPIRYIVISINDFPLTVSLTVSSLPERWKLLSVYNLAVKCIKLRQRMGS